MAMFLTTLLMGLVTIIAATCTESKDCSCMSKDLVDGANESQTALLQVNSAKRQCSKAERDGRICSNLPAWRVELGDRLVKATSADVQENDSGGFDLCCGGHVFCMHAVKQTTDTVAVSYGKEERDL